MRYHTETHTSIRPVGSWKLRFLAGFLGNMQRVLKALDDRRNVRELYKWSTDELKDIGVSRADVDREASKPIRFWG